MDPNFAAPPTFLTSDAAESTNIEGPSTIPIYEENYKVNKNSTVIKNLIKKVVLYLKTIDEAITVPIKIGDMVLGGKFKNKKMEVKKIGKNEILD